MSDPTDTTNTASSSPSSDPSSDRARCSRRGGRRRWGRRIGVIAVLLLGLAGLKAAVAGGGGHCGRHGGPVTAASVTEHMSWATDRALDHVDATDEQYKAVDAIIEQRAPELAGFAEEGRALKGRARQALVRDPTDRAALESLRAEALSLADRASAPALDDLVQLAAVLTPEQRQKLAETWEKRHQE